MKKINKHIEDIYLSIKGAKIKVRLITVNDRNKPLIPDIVMLHEGLGSIGQWKDFPEILIDRVCRRYGACRIFLYDRPGYGGSDIIDPVKTDDYQIKEAEEILPLVLKYLQVKNPILFGHSDGATIALIYAGAYPKNVSAVVSEASHVALEELTLNGIRKSVKLYKNTDFREKLRPYHGDKTDSVFYNWSNTWLNSDYKDWNIMAYLKKIECPVFAFQGDKDAYGSEYQIDIIKETVNSSLLTKIYPDCGHVPHSSHMDQVIFDFLEFMAFNLSQPIL